jgi:hypothetical protein
VACGWVTIVAREQNPDEEFRVANTIMPNTSITSRPVGGGGGEESQHNKFTISQQKRAYHNTQHVGGCESILRLSAHTNEGILYFWMVEAP